MKTEYVIWGIPPGDDDGERPLYTRARTLPEARRVMTILETRHGCRALRVQTIRPDVPPDFIAAVLS